MRLWRRVGLRGRLAMALASVAVVSVVLATLLSNAGLHSRLDQFARDRLQAAAQHSAQLAEELNHENGGWTPGARAELSHLAEMNGYQLFLSTPGSPGHSPPATHDVPTATAPIVLDGRTVGTLSIAPVRGEVLTGEDQALHHRLNRLHLLAGGLALVLGLIAAGIIAPAIARPLRRLTAAARDMQAGDLTARVTPSGAPEARQLGKAFNRLADTLEHEEQIRRDAAADVAHELRTPLAGIVSRIEAAQDGVLPDEESNLAAMHTEALRLSGLVEDLGRLAEAQQPGLTLQKERVDLSELVHERAQAYRDELRAKEIALEEHLEPVAAIGDRGRIVQIVDNLLSNALRYTDAGGTVTLTVRRMNGHAFLEVADTGIGIKGDDLPYIFERFWRGEPSRARGTGGAGIGLAIVRELVRAHEGRIDVESKPGHGSRFSVTLPAGHDAT